MQISLQAAATNQIVDISQSARLACHAGWPLGLTWLAGWANKVASSPGQVDLAGTKRTREIIQFSSVQFNLSPKVFKLNVVVSALV